MNQLGRESRALVDAARDGDDPSSEDRARVRRRLVQLGVGAALTTAASGTAAATAASMSGGASGVGAGSVATGAAASIAPGPLVAGGALATTTVASSFGVMAVKIVAAVVLVGGIGTASVKGVSTYRAHHASPASPTSVGVQPLMTPRVTTPVTLPAPIAGAPERTSPAVEPSPPPTSTPEATPPETQGVTTSGPRVTASTAHGSATSSGSFKAEYALLRGAEAMRVGGDPAGSLSSLDEYSARFPRGVLGEEYAAQRILTLCDLGRVAEAQVEGRRFLLEHPHSPSAEHVRESCARVSP